MDYVKLNERILTAFRKKLNGEGRVKKVNDEAVSGLEYSIEVMTTISKYYELIDDDENRRAESIHNKTVNVLQNKVNGSKKIKPLDDERVPGIMYSLSIMNNQRIYLYKSSLAVMVADKQKTK